MDPVPYTVSPEDVDEVLTAYAAPDDIREPARRHILQHVLDIAEIVRTAPPSLPDRREVALGVIEDILISDGFVDSDDDDRIYPISG